MSAASHRPISVSDLSGWTDSADVVVVGFGVAGASAAYEAAQAGASVRVLERAGAAGGAAALSDGMIYLGGGTATQKAAGVEDDPAAMKTFLMAACGPEPDEAKIDVYVERSIEHHDWLLDRGVQFLGTTNPESAGPSAADGEGLMYTGGENAYPFAELVPPAHRTHVTQGGRPGGSYLMAALSRAVLDTGAVATYDTRVERLVVDGDRVCGVVARRYGETVAIRAERGVVLTAGGFVFNDEMLRQYAPLGLTTTQRVGTEGDDGRGIRMAQVLGARVKRMDSLECAMPFNFAREHLHGFLVNDLGRRFVNEDTYMGRVGQVAMREKAVYLVVDEAHLVEGTVPGPPTWAAESAQELEAEMGLPDGSLQATLDYYNEHASHGEDPQFHKSATFLTPLQPPFAAFDISPGKFIYAMFTLGGLDTLPTGEVLDLDGVPVPGLYAAGRTTSGIAAQGYCSGLSLGDGSLFGRIAGQHAASQG